MTSRFGPPPAAKGVTDDDITKDAVGRFADGSPSVEGRIIGYCTSPMVCIRTANGQQVWWRADMTEVVSGPRPTEPADPTKAPETLPKGWRNGGFTTDPEETP